MLSNLYVAQVGKPFLYCFNPALAIPLKDKMVLLKYIEWKRRDRKIFRH